MRKITFFMFSLCMCVIALHAQDANTMAPNHYVSNSAIYKYRIKSYGTWQYEYSPMNRIVSIADTESVNKETFTYDANGYLKTEEDYDDRGLNSRTVFNRDAQGYVKESIFLTDFRGTQQGIEEFVRINYTYNDKKQVTKAVVEAKDSDTNSWVLAHTITLEYNTAGQLVKFVRTSPADEVLATETLEYNEKGKIISLSVTRRADYGETTTKWDYEYDENGDLVKSGRKEFPFTLTYDTTKLLSETFIPHANEHTFYYQGPSNALAGTMHNPRMPLDNSSVHAPLTYGSKTKTTTATYENVPKEDLANTEEIASDIVKVFPTVIKDALCIELPADQVGSIATIYTLDGQSVQAESLNASSMTLRLNLPQGKYLIAIAGKAYPFEVR